MIILTDKQKKVLDMLKKTYTETKRPVGPTAIGVQLGFQYESASSRVSPVLKRLIQLQLVERTNDGKYVPVSR